MVAKLERIGRRADQARCPAPVLLFTLRENNIDHLDGTVCLAAAHGIPRLTVNLFKRSDHRDWTEPYRQRIFEAFARAEERAGETGVALALPSHVGSAPVLLASASPGSRHACPFPSTEVVIRHDGGMTPCNMMNPFLYGNAVIAMFPSTRRMQRNYFLWKSFTRPCWMRVPWVSTRSGSWAVNRRYGKTLRRYSIPCPKTQTCD